MKLDWKEASKRIVDPSWWVSWPLILPGCWWMSTWRMAVEVAAVPEAETADYAGATKDYYYVADV